MSAIPRTRHGWKDEKGCRAVNKAVGLDNSCQGADQNSDCCLFCGLPAEKRSLLYPGQRASQNRPACCCQIFITWLFCYLAALSFI